MICHSSYTYESTLNESDILIEVVKLQQLTNFATSEWFQ